MTSALPSIADQSSRLCPEGGSKGRLERGAGGGGCGGEGVRERVRGQRVRGEAEMGRNALSQARVARSQGRWPRGRRAWKGGGIPATMCGASRGARGAPSPPGKGALGARPGKSNPPREEAGAVGVAAAGSSPGASAIWVRTRRPRGRARGPADSGLLSARRSAPLPSARPQGPCPDSPTAEGPAGRTQVRVEARGGRLGGRGPDAAGLRRAERHFRRRPRRFRLLRESPPRHPLSAGRPPAGRRCGASDPACGGFLPGAACRAGVWKLQPWDPPAFARRPPVLGARPAGGVLRGPAAPCRPEECHPETLGRL